MNFGFTFLHQIEHKSDYEGSLKVIFVNWGGYYDFFVRYDVQIFIMYL